MEAPKILITGCSGFIGRHATRYALSKGYKVVGLDLNNIDIKHKRFSFILGDINDRETVSKAVRGCNYVLHLAAATSLPDFQYDLYKNYSTNILGFLNVIEEARKSGCKKLVYASSSAVYQKEYAENAVIDTHTQRNHYGKSKLIDEMIAESYIDTCKMGIAGVRYFNVYGPGEDVKERPSPITKFLTSKRKDNTITIFGDGKQSKDFIYINDAIKITFKLLSNNSVGTFNVGTGVATSFNYIAKFIKPNKIIYTKNPYLSSYIFYLKADTSKLLKSMKKYKFITVKEGIVKMTR